MKTILRNMSLGFMLAAVAFWIVSGANRGWTKTQVARETRDAVTGISGVTYEKKFVPGLDFLAAAALCSLILTAAAWFPGNPRNPKSDSNSSKPKL